MADISYICPNVLVGLEFNDMLIVKDSLLLHEIAKQFFLFFMNSNIKNPLLISITDVYKAPQN